MSKFTNGESELFPYNAITAFSRTIDFLNHFLTLLSKGLPAANAPIETEGSYKIQSMAVSLLPEATLSLFNRLAS